jgi:hypothetical protein
MAAAHFVESAVERFIGHRCGAIRCLEAAATAAEGDDDVALTRSVRRVVETARLGLAGALGPVVPAVPAARVEGGAPTHDARAIAAYDAWATHWRARDVAQSAAVLEQLMLTDPTDSLGLTLLHHTYSAAGDTANLSSCVARVMPFWDARTPGFVNMLTMRSTALLESGGSASAEIARDVAMNALEHDPTHSPAILAAAVAYDATGAYREGLRFLREAEEDWQLDEAEAAVDGDDGGVALAQARRINSVWISFELEQGNEDAALRRYDGELGYDMPRDVASLVDVTNTLGRLHFANVPIGERWGDLAAAWSAAAPAKEPLCAMASASRALAFSLAGVPPAGDGDGQVEGDASELDVAIARSQSDPAGALATLVGPQRSRAARQLGGLRFQRELFDWHLPTDCAVRSPRAEDALVARALLAERTAERPQCARTWWRLSETLDHVDATLLSPDDPASGVGQTARHTAVSLGYGSGAWGAH